MRRCLLVLVVLVAAAACATSGTAPTVTRRWPVMGTFAAVDLRAADPAVASAAADTVARVLARVDASMSNWKDDSALAIANREARRGSAAIDDLDLRRCLVAAFDGARRTQGAFDPTVGPLMTLYGFRPRAPRVPSEAEIDAVLVSVGWAKAVASPDGSSLRFEDPAMEIDLGGIAKGFALDLAREEVEPSDLEGALLDLGGNILAWGRPPGGEAWRVGVRDPLEDGALAAVVTMALGAAATSGDYENSFRAGGSAYGHIMDPRTGRPAVTDVVSATALAPDATTADVLSTSLFVVGADGASTLLERFPGAEAILVTRQAGGLAIRASGTLAGRVSVDPGFAARHGARIAYDLAPR